MSGGTPYFSGALVARFQGQELRVWAINPEQWQQGPLRGVWNTQEETRQVETGQTLVSQDYSCNRFRGAGSRYGMPCAEVCVELGNRYNRGFFYANGWTLARPSDGVSYDIWVRCIPYEVYEIEYRTEYRYTGFILPESAPLVIGYPDIQAGVETPWMTELPPSSDFEMEWLSPVLCDPQKEITCGDLARGWCCIDCSELSQELRGISESVSRNARAIQRMNQALRGK